jgi:hypothetical protein
MTLVGQAVQQVDGFRRVLSLARRIDLGHAILEPDHGELVASAHPFDRRSNVKQRGGRERSSSGRARS